MSRSTIHVILSIVYSLSPIQVVHFLNSENPKISKPNLVHEFLNKKFVFHFYLISSHWDRARSQFNWMYVGHNTIVMLHHGRSGEKAKHVQRIALLEFPN